MTAKISIIIVHYETPDLLERMLESIFDSNDFEDGLFYEVIIVNNGGDLSRIDNNRCSDSLQIIETKQNLGYARGVNLGVNHSSSDLLILANADLVFHNHSLKHMVDALINYDIVGPQFYWDLNCKIYLPPTESSSLSYSLLKVLSKKNRFFDRRMQKVYWKQVSNHIFGLQPILSRQLSGACLALRRSCWNRVGPFDANFMLYFEEVDWLIRANKKGCTSAYLPNVRVTHFFNQSSKKQKQSNIWFDESALYFSIKHHSIFRNWINNLIMELGTPLAIENNSVWIRHKNSSISEFLPLPLPDYDLLPQNSYYLEASIFISFIPAATIPVSGDVLTSEWVLPHEIWDNLEPSKYYFRLVNSKREKVLPYD